jgi:hypothetical protein
MNKKKIDIDKLIDGYYESDIHQYYSQKGEGQASANASLSMRMKAGLARKRALLSIKVGAHIKGGKKSISKLLEWQKDNDFRVCDLERTDEWKRNIGESNKGKVKSDELKQTIRNTVNKFNESLTQEERSKKYSNDSTSRKALKLRIEVLNMIPTDIFNTSDAKLACEKCGLGNWKGFLRDERIIKVIRKGTNQSNPGIYQKK